MTYRILAYHRISIETAPGLEEWAIHPVAFRRQMELLRRLGYRGVSLREMLDSMESGDGQKLIALTFDDGYLDTVETALPILSEFGFRASVYVVPANIGGTASWETEGPDSALASWSQLAQLVDAGWEIGMHSHSHPARLDLLSGPALVREASRGLDTLQKRLRTPVDSFAYPHGHYSDEAIQALKDAGFRHGLTRDAGLVTPTTDRYRLHRYELKRRDTLLEFACMLMTSVLPRRRTTLQRLNPSRLRHIAKRERVEV